MTLENKVIAWADSVGLLGPVTTQEKRFLKLTEELGELGKAILHDDKMNAIEELGGMAVVMVQMAYKLGFTLEECLKIEYLKISKRDGELKNGTFIKTTT